ncbi:hypothetical protein L226DRAFT_526976 [Lentinus tigrinus ALCF2SS1-7]|uniref:Uncharacterized protein n=1 Tax=Lentinus tigrinus ALCF2SS1-6 TaxID=1328759 RepID=A0A5C2RQJ6_9APHY|nr:hypothetical protein L227DRAFT_567660 [Lentinus tigrinus ALCF2SS1-6]RPD68781.1 hypothetical protein L226DRAFT_526976 [Lentinus tigrinus ALCF2SS1-7]
MARSGPPIGRTKRANSVYSTKASADRGLLRKVLDMDIVYKTGDPGAQMRWEAVAFRRDIVLFHGVILVGWLPRAVFQNPSKMQMSVIRSLLWLFERGRLYFRRATPGEIFAARESLYNAVPGLRFALPITRNCHMNLNQHWVRPTIDPAKFPPRFIRNGTKSTRGVDTDESGDDEGNSEGTETVSEIEDADEYWGAVVPLRKRFHELEEDPISDF